MPPEEDPPDAAVSPSNFPARRRSRSGFEPRMIINVTASTGTGRPGADETDHVLQNDIVLYEALLTEIASEGFGGTLWSETSNQLVSYGLGVIGAWVKSGTVYKKLMTIGQGVKPLPVPFSAEEQQDLTTDVVTAGFDRFIKRVLVERQWDPSRGAGLATYFIRLCLGEFSNVYRSHARRLRSRIKNEVLAGDLDILWGVAPSAEHVGNARMELLDALKRVPPGPRRAMIMLSALGYTDREIAVLLEGEEPHVSPDGVRSRRAHLRRKFFGKDQSEGGRDA